MLLVMTPVGLEQDGVDVLGVDGFGLVAHGLDHGTDAEVFDRPDRALRAAGDETLGGVHSGTGTVTKTTGTNPAGNIVAAGHGGCLCRTEKPKTGTAILPCSICFPCFGGSVCESPVETSANARPRQDSN